LAYHDLGQPSDSDAALEELIMEYEELASYNIAYVHAWRGEVDAAFATLEKAVLYQDAGLSALPFDPLFKNIHDDPRWPVLLERLGLSHEQLAAIEFEVTLPR
jgi:hypothetical protein